MASVTIEDVRKVYGALEVLHGVSIDVEDGEFVVLVGPSGCGKSTLLRMIAGLEAISGGLIGIDDKVINDVPPKERDIAMVFQSYALYPHMTVAENMGFSLKLRGAPKARIDQEVTRASAILGLDELIGRYPRQLSGGQRQRVAMGRAIVRDPKVFLFDEPLSNLDAKLRVQMRTEIREMHQRIRTTTVYVTHDQIEAMTMADKIVVMNQGNVEQVGTPLEVYDHPVNRFVASFIGSPSMNFIEGTVEAGDGVSLRTNANDRLPLPASMKPHAGQPIVCGVRPEHIDIANGKTPGAVGCETLVIEPTGHETMVVFSFAGRSISGLFRERHDFAPGTPVSITVKPQNMRFFDPQTGASIPA